MTGSVFSPTFEALPASIPVFPLMGVLLLPGGRLPLNIFEPRYVSMIDDALGDARMIGMIQPTEHENTTSAPNLNRTGCAGRLTSFSETPDGRYLITLSGLCRFDIESEVPTTRGYRRAVVDWNAYQGDFAADEDFEFDRDRLFSVLRTYFTQKGVEVDWEALEQTSACQLTTTLSMVCPFTAAEKQALLEAKTIENRCETVITLLEMAVHAASEGGDARH